jgi:hypothetical protein
MNNYKIIHFESNEIRIKKITNKLYIHNAKYWNKLFSICRNYLLEKKYLNAENVDINYYILEMNKPVIIRNCGLNHFKALKLENKDFVETDYIFPSGKMVSKLADAYYNMISKKYVMLAYKKEKNIEHITIIKHKRLAAYLKGNVVKKYHLKINNENYKVIIDE